jgi:Tfp pilus assembly protein PilN
VLLISVAFIAGCTIVLWPLMRALARRIEGRQAASPALQAEIEQLRARVADVDVLQHRVAELEERVDFAERLLAQKREPERLGRGGV